MTLTADIISNDVNDDMTMMTRRVIDGNDDD